MASKEDIATNRSGEDTEGTELSAPTSAVAADLAALNLHASDDKDNINITCAAEAVGDDDDMDLFGPPPPSKECPLCFLPLPNEGRRATYRICCGKTICNGCDLKHFAVRLWTNMKRAVKDPPESPIENNCQFCREPIEVSDEEKLKRVEKRMESKDSYAFCHMANAYDRGIHGLPRDMAKAMELYLRAVELGSAEACFSVAIRYDDGGSLGRDQSKEMLYLKHAAKRGHILARHNLGCEEEQTHDNFQLAVKHWMISAAAGDDESLKAIGRRYRLKHATKDQYEEALRAHQKAKKAMSSDERDLAKKYYDGGRGFSVFSQTEMESLCGIRKKGEFQSILEAYSMLDRTPLLR